MDDLVERMIRRIEELRAQHPEWTDARLKHQLVVEAEARLATYRDES